MTPSPEKAGRILLGLRATSDGDRSVLTAITLAKAIRREIVGLFVIEEEMVEMAGLPFTCTLETGTAQRLDLTAAIMSKALDRGGIPLQAVLIKSGASSKCKLVIQHRKWEIIGQIERGDISRRFLGYLG